MTFQISEDKSSESQNADDLNDLNNCYFVFFDKQTTFTLIIDDNNLKDFRFQLNCDNNDYFCYAINQTTEGRPLNYENEYEKYLDSIVIFESNQQIHV